MRRVAHFTLSILSAREFQAKHADPKSTNNSFKGVAIAHQNTHRWRFFFHHLRESKLKQQNTSGTGLTLAHSFCVCNSTTDDIIPRPLTSAPLPPQGPPGVRHNTFRGQTDPTAFCRFISPLEGQSWRIPQTCKVLIQTPRLAQAAKRTPSIFAV